MSQQELLKKVISALEAVGIDYMITGSIASSLQGEPRSTHDIDIIIIIQTSSVDKFVEFFPPSMYYLNKDSIFKAIENHDMFNLIEISEGDKVDFWILTDDTYDRIRFSRKYTEEFSGIKIQVSRPEDTILSKLRWAMLSGGSEKQFIDALRIYEVQYEILDKDYLEYWVRELNIGSLWKRLKQEADIEIK